MADDKSLLGKIDSKVEEIARKAEQVIEDIGADEQPLKVVYPDADKTAEPPKK